MSSPDPKEAETPSKTPLSRAVVLREEAKRAYGARDLARALSLWLSAYDCSADPTLFSNLAAVLMEIGAYARAAAACEEALAAVLCPSARGKIQRRRTRALGCCRRWGEAASALRSATDAEPSDGDSKLLSVLEQAAKYTPLPLGILSAPNQQVVLPSKRFLSDGTALHPFLLPPARATLYDHRVFRPLSEAVMLPLTIDPLPGRKARSPSLESLEKEIFQRLAGSIEAEASASMWPSREQPTPQAASFLAASNVSSKEPLSLLIGAVGDVDNLLPTLCTLTPSGAALGGMSRDPKAKKHSLARPVRLHVNDRHPAAIARMILILFCASNEEFPHDFLYAIRCSPVLDPRDESLLNHTLQALSCPCLLSAVLPRATMEERGWEAVRRIFIRWEKERVAFGDVRPQMISDAVGWRKHVRCEVLKSNVAAVPEKFRSWVKWQTRLFEKEGVFVPARRIPEMSGLERKQVVAHCDRWAANPSFFHPANELRSLTPGEQSFGCFDRLAPHHAFYAEMHEIRHRITGLIEGEVADAQLLRDPVERHAMLTGISSRVCLDAYWSSFQFGLTYLPLRAVSHESLTFHFHLCEFNTLPAEIDPGSVDRIESRNLVEREGFLTLLARTRPMLTCQPYSCIRLAIGTPLPRQWLALHLGADPEWSLSRIQELLPYLTGYEAIPPSAFQRQLHLRPVRAASLSNSLLRYRKEMTSVVRRLAELVLSPPESGGGGSLLPEISTFGGFSSAGTFCSSDTIASFCEFLAHLVRVVGWPAHVLSEALTPLFLPDAGIDVPMSRISPAKVGFVVNRMNAAHFTGDLVVHLALHAPEITLLSLGSLVADRVLYPTRGRFALVQVSAETSDPGADPSTACEWHLPVQVCVLSLPKGGDPPFKDSGYNVGKMSLFAQFLAADRKFETVHCNFVPPGTFKFYVRLKEDAPRSDPGAPHPVAAVSASDLAHTHFVAFSPAECSRFTSAVPLADVAILKVVDIWV